MIIRAGRPGLLGTVARTAVVAGTAQAVAGRISHRQQQRWAEEAVQQPPQPPQPPQPAVRSVPAPPPNSASDATDLVTLLRELATLRDEGILTDAEFEAKKAQLLAG